MAWQAVSVADSLRHRQHGGGVSAGIVGHDVNSLLTGTGLTRLWLFIAINCIGIFGFSIQG